ncbi:hypothetical protein [Streptomyces sp. 11x1]|uniref:hypothetical protein n=1 Tax=Streptomyces sp. 11x1 TaxID=3038642 RepID=UPI0037D9B7A4
MAFGDGQGQVDGVDGTRSGGAGGEDDRADLPGAQDVLQSDEAPTAPVVGGAGVLLPPPENVTHMAVGVAGDASD